MIKNLKSNLHLVSQLLKRDGLFFMRNFKHKLVDCASFLITTLVTFEFLLPAYGLKADYGSFLIIGMIVGYGLYQIVGRIFVVVLDIEGDQTLSYLFMVPAKTSLTIGYIGFWWSVMSALYGVILLIMGKIVLFNSFDLTQINYLKFIPMFIVSNLFFGYFALWITSIFGAKTTGDLFTLVINPMYSFGGFFYSWKMLFKISAIAAYINLLNPLIYVMEGMRSTALNPNDFLPFWLCFPMVILITSILAWDAIRRLKKRMDLV